MKPPDAPPPLAALAAHQAELEKKRAGDFAAWRAALEAHRGNVTAAATSLGWTRARGDKATKRFELAEWARALRVKAGGAVGGGRPPGAKGKKRRTT